MFWEQGFDKVRASSRTLKLLKQFDVQFQMEHFAGFCGHTRLKHA
jgi:hypothetical protein